MLFKQIHLEGIKSGSIDLAFRKWKKPMVKVASLVKTSVGQIEIRAISEIEGEEVSETEARRAGFESSEDLLALLQKTKEGTVYRIELRYHSEDPRIELRNQSELTDEEWRSLRSKLERLDRYSKVGNWTHETLEAISENPGLRAADLAVILAREKDWLKPNIRKLKNLGLTISHEVGYEISPLGRAYLGRVGDL